MSDVPGELTGNHPLAPYLNKLRRAVIARTPMPTVGVELIRTPNGFSIKPNVKAGGAASESGGRLLGHGSVSGTGLFPNFGTIRPFDMVHYFTLPPAEGVFVPHAVWVFAWGGPGNIVQLEGSGGGPIPQIRNAGAPSEEFDLPFEQRANKWFLVSMSTVANESSSDYTVDDALQTLVDAYPDQV